MDALSLVLKYAVLVGGPWKLRGGGESNYYVDVRSLMLTHEGLRLVADEFYSRLRGGVVGGPSTGADPIVGALVYKGARGFLVRPGEKNHGVAGRLIGEIKPGERVAVLDDVATTGDSLLEVINIARMRGANVTKAWCVVDREWGARERLATAGVELWSLVVMNQITSATGVPEVRG